ncbi:hypothetical protein ATCC90586_009099 [Pythium insidiosum]|nr:hypothetical protein ATCC90586_009099 [Pythium insidiosum]
MTASPRENRCRPRTGARRLVWRTRDSENSRLYNLQLDVQAMQQQLRSLTQYRQALLTRSLQRPLGIDDSLVRMVHEYFRVFHRGYTSSGPMSSEDVFIRQFMDQRVVCGRFAGLDLLLRQWERYSQSLGPLTLTLMDVAVHPSSPSTVERETLIVARVRYEILVTRATLETVFPRVRRHDELVRRLVGRQLEGIGRFAFVFDAARRRVVRQELELDFATAFASVLRSPRLLATLFDGAQISQEWYIGDLSDFPTTTSIANVEPAPLLKMTMSAILTGDEPSPTTQQVPPPSGRSRSYV